MCCKKSMKLLSLALTLFVLTTACSQKKVKLDNPSTEFLPGKRLAELKNKDLSEVSGIAASISNPGFLWVHNDSGNGTEIFLINDHLKVLLTCKLKGIDNRDWEDITVGPGPDSTKHYLYVGDIGDNDAKYQYKYIYRFEEPVLTTGVKQLDITDMDMITFQLPDKRKDTESLLINPATKDLYIVSKREEPVYLYELKYPYSTQDTLTATEVMSLPFTQIVSGDFSMDGKEILMKNYEHVYWWSNPSGKPVVEVLKEKPKEIPYEIEPQGEAITWSLDNSGFYTLSEKNQGKDSYLYFYQRK